MHFTNTSTLSRYFLSDFQEIKQILLKMYLNKIYVRSFCAIFALICFVIVIFDNFILIPLYIFVRPINRKFYRQIAFYMHYITTSTICFISTFWATTNIKLYINNDDYKYLCKEKALIIMNHSSEVDWIFLFILADHLNILGNVKYFIKKTVFYIPFVGTAFLLQDCVFLERSFDKDKKNIEDGVKNLIDDPYSIWLTLFAEGTRFTNKKQLESVQFAKERNLAELKHHLYPRIKGFTSCAPLIKKGFNAVYNIELIFSTQKGVPTLLSLINREHLDAHFYIKRIPVNEIPDTEAEQGTFLTDMYLEKDRLQDSFKSTGSFFTTSGIEEVPHIVLNRSIWSAINFMFWFFLTTLGYLFFAINLVRTENYFIFSIWIGVLVGMVVLSNKIMDIIVIKEEKNKQL